MFQCVIKIISVVLSICLHWLIGINIRVLGLRWASGRVCAVNYTYCEDQ